MNWYNENRSWMQRAERWRSGSYEPLRLRAWLAAPVAYDGYDPITLDGSLQYAVCVRETGRLPDDVYSGCPLSEPLEHTDIPIPIADTAMGDVPLANISIGWFSLDAVPTKRQNWKRADAESYALDVVRISSAENKTQMVAKATVTAQYVDFFANANVEMLTDLLRDVSNLGAGRSGGLGLVHGWEVLPWKHSWWFRGPSYRLMRPLPADHEIGDVLQYDERIATLRAPYWHPQTRRLCVVPVQRLGEWLPITEAA